ncbi:hypothetical protein NM208_g6607 [Fusarium decemcellulare]|uniref:Uncharacterized protein n=1 Tax=Fusarium decemcellulare TaxID=57161 RepID=A0ACC1SCE1_9HYPO|nr:hypothetical protein NM208_g6607 [Fusarium decemcellulare]
MVSFSSTRGCKRGMGLRIIKFVILTIAVILGTACLPAAASATSEHADDKLKVEISVAKGLLYSAVDGRIVLMFAPRGVDPLSDIDVSSTPNLFFGMNVFDTKKHTFTLSGGKEEDTLEGVHGWPVTDLDDIPSGTYRVQAFLNKYEKATRSDGSTVRVRFPCGDGAPSVNGYGSLTTSAMDVNVHGGRQTIKLTFDKVTEAEPFTGKEIGGCAQGNYPDTRTFKHVKIRSKKLSDFWGRDMYVGANVVLPHGYNPKDKSRRYPVLYTQSHWSAGGGSFGYPEADFKNAWDTGVIPASKGKPSRPTPKMLLVTIRHESPYYDDSYAVNSANLGPWGDAINDELIPYIDKAFNTIPKPYARVQEGGSTGGWISVASVVFRPDLFGACFASYPDSLDFHRHQDIPLYDGKNAYRRPDGSEIGSVREFRNGKEIATATVAQENHWELVFGTSSRSSLQWDIWNAVFGVQGLNGYPLEPWDKVTGEIYPDAVEYWKPMDLTQYILNNWNGYRQLGKVLKGRLFIYVGSWDTCYLNEGVQEFQKRISAKGGPDWANVTILPEKTHGGNYQDREFWDYLELVYSWIQDHAPDGKSPLAPSVTSSFARGNDFEEALRLGGHSAAVARQAPPQIKGRKLVKAGTAVQASVGRWDPGTVLEAKWIVNGKATGRPFKVEQGQVLHRATKPITERRSLQLVVTGRKRGYAVEERKSNIVVVEKSAIFQGRKGIIP